MKLWIYPLILTLISCNNGQEKVSSLDKTNDTVQPVKSGPKSQSKNEISWTGSLNGKTPIFIHYQLDGNLVVGEITYLSTKEKRPIKLLGTIEQDKNYRLLEFDKSGNITGIITGLPNDRTFNGSWFSPKTEKELIMKLSLLDTILSSPDIKPLDYQIFGNYHYQYGKDGFNGDFEINKVGNEKIDFNILSLTNIDRGPNIAEVERDTIAMSGNSFVYKIPESDSCEFKATFYKDFVFVNYTKGYCSGQFGLNATIDGIFLKIK